MKTNRMNVVISVALGVATLQFVRLAHADDEPLKQRSTPGTISTVNASQRALEVKQFLLTRNFNLANNCSIAVGNKPQASVADLKPGMEIRIHYQNADGVLVASRIEQQKKSGTGTIHAMDSKDRKLTLDEGAFKKQIRIGDDCNIVMNDNKAGTLGDLRVGQRVRIEYVKNGEGLAALKIEQPNPTFVGTLNAIDAIAETVKAKHLLSSQKFNLADDCRIVINGKSDGRLSDLRIGEKVAIDYRDVNGVYVATRIAPANALEKAGQSQELTRVTR